MEWQIIAIWLIAGTTTAWFLLSENRRRFSALAEKARHFAVDPAYRHRPVASTTPVQARQAYVPTGLSQSDRMFLEAIAQNARRQDSSPTAGRQDIFS